MTAKLRMSCLLALTIVCTSVFAAAPTTMTYQGYLTNASGATIDDPLSVTFNIYTTALGGVPLWTSTRSVAVDGGLITIELGESVPFPPGLFDTPLWLGVAVDTDGEMTPRRALTSVGFAFNSDLLQGQPAAAYDQSAHVNDNANPHGVTAADTGALTAQDIVSLQTDLAQALAAISTLQGQVTTLQSDVTDIDTIIGADGAVISQLENQVGENSLFIQQFSTDISNNATAIAALSSNSVLALDGTLTLDQTDPSRPAARFNGVNVQITSGAGATDAAPNGTGNLIVGYDEIDVDAPICSLGQFTDLSSCTGGGGVWAASHKSGSHNIVLGKRLNYSRYGGLVVGSNNSITGPYASVSGGEQNAARAFGASVSGGVDNVARGNNASISGGSQNVASGNSSSVGGGSQNNASGLSASVGGGQSQSASSTNTFEAADSSALTALATTVSGLQGNSVLSLDGVLDLDTTGTYPVARFTGVNVQIVNGSGSTYGLPTGTGNLVIGYDGPGGFCSNPVFHGDQATCEISDSWMPSEKWGSHNVVVGDGHQYTQFGGLISGFNNRTFGDAGAVAGQFNTVDRFASSVSGGSRNTASGAQSSVSGGKSNSANGDSSAISGGFGNTAIGDTSAVSGGSGNTTAGTLSTVAGGVNNNAAGPSSTISGGSFNFANGLSSVVSGGGGLIAVSGNTANGDYSVVGGGNSITATTANAFEAADSTAVSSLQSSVASIQANSVLGLDGLLSLDTSGPHAVALFEGVNVQIVNDTGTTDGTPNGTGNLIIGYDGPGGFCSTSSLYPDESLCNTVGGGIWLPSEKTGSHNVVIGDGHHYSRFGGLVSGFNNRISGDWGNVTGGSFNTAGGVKSSVSGGFANSATNDASSISGGLLNAASGQRSSVIGGENNTASGYASSVNGGSGNTADGNWSAVSGGRDRDAPNSHDTRIGDTVIPD